MLLLVCCASSIAATNEPIPLETVLSPQALHPRSRPQLVQLIATYSV